MTGIRIGSLFSGIGGLDLAVEEVFGGSVAWHVQYDPQDRHQYAAQALAHRWPGVPNLGDITRVDFTQVEPVDILCGGFPCQDVSLAGQGAGLAEGTRSGLWFHMARAARELQPRLVVIENVEGLLSAKAVRDLGSESGDLGEGPGAALPLRALGAVLGDLAGLGLDAEWARVAASEVGAAHQRKRVFILAWPADTAANAANLGHDGGGRARGGWTRPADGGVIAADAERDRQQGQRRDAGPASERSSSPVVGCGLVGGGAVAPDADGRGREGHSKRDGGPLEGQPGRQPGVDPAGPGALRGATPDAESIGRSQGRTEPARQQGGPDAVLGGGFDWGRYANAIARWEACTGRPAPRAVDDRGRLAPVFVEWMMGLPDGHVTAVPGMPRSAQLKALGNGVVPQQAATALRLLWERAGAEAAA